MTAHACPPDCAWCDYNRGARYSQAFWLWASDPQHVTHPPDRDASDDAWRAWAAENGLEFVTDDDPGASGNGAPPGASSVHPLDKKGSPPMPRMTIEEARKMTDREVAAKARALVKWAEQNDATLDMAHDVRTLVLLAYSGVIADDDAALAREAEEAAQKAEDAQIEAEAQELARKQKVEQRAAELAQAKPAATIPALAREAEDDLSKASTTPSTTPSTSGDAQPNTNT